MKGVPLSNINGHHWVWAEADLYWCPRCAEVFQMNSLDLSEPCQEPPAARYITPVDLAAMRASRPEYNPYKPNASVVTDIPSGHIVQIWPSGEVFLKEGKHFTYLLDLNYHTVPETEAAA